MTTTAISPYVAETQSRSNATAESSSTSSTSTSTSDSATISANDFLTLLVTELKNQDPTTATDPTEYINQLVNVNSLEQLISINSTLTSALDSSSTSSSSTSTSESRSSSAQATQAASTSSRTANAATTTSNSVSTLAPGNISVPAANSAAARVARSLSGQQ